MKFLVFLIVLVFSSFSYSLELDVTKEIAMASEGAPNHITSEATILAFGNGDFSVIRKGTNNFTCFVVRDPNDRYEPACLNEEAVRSVLPTYQLHMKSLYSGSSYADTKAKIKKAFDAGNIPTAEPGALVYMMSPNNQIFNDAEGKLEPTSIHQMYFYPKLKDETFSFESGPPWLWQGFPHMSALIVEVSKDRD